MTHCSAGNNTGRCRNAGIAGTTAETTQPATLYQLRILRKRNLAENLLSFIRRQESAPEGHFHHPEMYQLLTLLPQRQLQLLPQQPGISLKPHPTLDITSLTCCTPEDSTGASETLFYSSHGLTPLGLPQNMNSIES